MKLNKRMKGITATLFRLEDDGTQTLGNLQVYRDGIAIEHFYTLEPAWKNNRNNISSIPAGEYEVLVRRSKRFGTHFHITRVKGRKYILIHAGNYRSDTSGCILIGTSTADIDGDGKMDVTNSRVAMRKLLKTGKRFTLTIKDIV
jgi:hypothetical protein